MVSFRLRSGSVLNRVAAYAMGLSYNGILLLTLNELIRVRFPVDPRQCSTKPLSDAEIGRACHASIAQLVRATAS